MPSFAMSVDLNWMVQLKEPPLFYSYCHIANDGILALLVCGEVVCPTLGAGEAVEENERQQHSYPGRILPKWLNAFEWIKWHSGFPRLKEESCQFPSLWGLHVLLVILSTNLPLHDSKICTFSEFSTPRFSVVVNVCVDGWWRGIDEIYSLTTSVWDPLQNIYRLTNT